MCNTNCCNGCCKEKDLLCCMPIKHCCGGYSEHNNCCPHDRCCNSCCGCGCCCCDCEDKCKKCCCVCPCVKKEIENAKTDVKNDINNLESRVLADENNHANDIANLIDDLAEETQFRIAGDAALDDKLAQEIARAKAAEGALDDKIDQEVADRIADVNAEEARAKAAENNLDDKLDQEIADRKADAIADVDYINNAGDAYIKFINANGEEIKRIDAKPFIKDGMISDVTIEDYQGDKALKFIFNTDHGHSSPIYINIGDLFEQENYYTKGETDNEISSEAQTRNAADTALSNTISNEASRAQGAEQGLQNSINSLNQRAVTNVAYDSTNKKITKTINGTTTDVVTLATLKSDLNLSNVTNDPLVKRTEMGVANGVATLDSNGKVPTAQIPALGYVNGGSISGNTITLTKGDGSTPITITIPTQEAAGSLNITIDGSSVTIQNAVQGLADRIAALEAQNYWMLSNSTLIPKNSYTVTAPAFYDSSVN